MLSEQEHAPANSQEPDLTPVLERTDFPPLLNVIVPAVILVVSVAYAWSLRDIVNARMNLLFLKPVFVVIWGLVLIVVVRDVIPSIRQHAQWRERSSQRSATWRERFASGTEAGAGLVVLATFVFAVFGPGNGPTQYLVSTFLYLLVVGYLIGDRHPVKLIAQAAILATGLYLLMGVALGVRL
jgi:uncharacterized membrane protein